MEDPAEAAEAAEETVQPNMDSFGSIFFDVYISINALWYKYIYIYYIYLWHIPCTYYEQIWEDDWSEIIHITQADIHTHIMLELFWMAQVRENWTSPPKIGWMHPNKEGYPMQSMPEISDKLQKECYSRNYIAQGEGESRVDLTWVYTIYICIRLCMLMYIYIYLCIRIHTVYFCDLLWGTF